MPKLEKCLTHIYLIRKERITKQILKQDWEWVGRVTPVIPTLLETETERQQF